MKNLKKVALMSFAIIAVAAISFFSTNTVSNNANVQDQIASTENIQLANFDWTNYDLNSTGDADKFGSGKCGDDKKKAESKTDTKKDSKKCGDGKCGDDKKKSESKTEKKSEKKSEKCGTGKCGKA